MIKVEIQGVTFECETPQQAVEIAKLMNAGTKPASSAKAKNTYGQQVVADLIVPHGHTNPAITFLYRIKDLPATDVSSSNLAKALDVKGASGIGPRLAKIEQQLAELQPPIRLDNVLEKHVRPGQPIHWKIRPEARDIWRTIENSLL